jgi:hypothetical protein
VTASLSTEAADRASAISTESASLSSDVSTEVADRASAISTTVTGVNSVFMPIFERLRTITRFMSVLQDQAYILDTAGQPIDLTAAMKLSVGVQSDIDNNSGLLVFPESTIDFPSFQFDIQVTNESGSSLAFNVINTDLSATLKAITWTLTDLSGSINLLNGETTVTRTGTLDWAEAESVANKLVSSAAPLNGGSYYIKLSVTAGGAVFFVKKVTLTV